jgi:hypothetical protein
MANELGDSCESVPVLVDNYESLDDVMGIRRFLSSLVEQIPPNCHLALAGRLVPGLSPGP